MLLTRIDHLGIAVVDLDAAVEHYTANLGFAVVVVETNAEQGVREAMLTVGEDRNLDSPLVQLLEPLVPDSPVGRFIAKRGEGLHHVAYVVEDVAAAMEEFASLGIRLVDERPRRGTRGSLIAFAQPKDLRGVLTELVQPARQSIDEFPLDTV